MQEQLHSPAAAGDRKHVMLFLLAVSIFINYIDRSNLSIAAPFIKDELQLNPSQLGLLLSAFFWSYAPFQPVSGWLVDRFDAARVLAAGFFLWSAATAGIGLVHGFALLFALRILLGIGESVAFPAYSKILSTNFLEAERGFANAIIATGLTLGPAFGMFCGGMLVARFGWRPYFVVLGGISMVWLMAWWQWKPSTSAPRPKGRLDAPSLLQFVKLRAAWGTCLGLFFLNYVSYFLITWMPFYLHRERNFSMKQIATIAGLSYVAAAIMATSSGWLSDRWLRAGASATRARITFNAGGVAACAVLLIACAAMPQYSAVLMICAVACFGIGAANVWAVTQTVAGPRAAGRWTGMQNLVGNVAGILAPTVTGFVLTRTGQFFWPFLITATSGLLGCLCWIFVLGPVRQVQWGSSAPAVVEQATVSTL